tara:strand:- start:5477 stop:6055 length:579 start_codon:yes stop_codon:yes gene_type:complete
MKTFEQWLKEDAPGSNVNYAGAGIPQAQPQATQPSAGQPNANQQPPHGPPIPQGQEAVHVKNMISGGLSGLEPKELGAIFETGFWYLNNHGQPQMQKFYTTIKAALNSDIMSKYVDDAANMAAQRRVWDGETLPNTLQYEPQWANTAFQHAGSDEMGDGQHWFDKAVDVGSEFASRIGQLTQGKTQSSVFGQ